MNPLLVIACCVVLLGGLSACGEKTPKPDSPTVSTSSSPSPSVSPSSAGITEKVMIHGGKTTPTGKLVQLKVGEPLTLEIMADAAGELHVHSTPEQHVEFTSGTSSHTLVIDKPGVVEVEDHESGTLILKLQVR